VFKARRLTSEPDGERAGRPGRDGRPRRFATARALVKHAGLAPREELSGTFTGRSKHTGQGRPGLRLAAWRAVRGAQRANPVYQARYQHLTGRHINKWLSHAPGPVAARWDALRGHGRLCASANDHGECPGRASPKAHNESAPAWHDERVVNAVRAFGCSKLIIAVVSLEVCAALPAIAATAEGFDAYVAVGVFDRGGRKLGVLGQRASVSAGHAHGSRWARARFA